MLGKCKFCTTNSGYRESVDCLDVVPAGSCNFCDRYATIVREMYEITNHWFKIFATLRQRLRYLVERHGMTFQAEERISQLTILSRGNSF